MKIINVEKITEPVYYVQTDRKDYYYYRRYSDGSWEVAMGESWETVFNETELEILFQEFLKLNE